MSSSELRKGFSPTYFSLEDIIASQTRVPCRALVNFDMLGCLDAGQDSSNLPPECQFELPIWAAQKMAKKDLVRASLPKFFNGKFREVLKADPSVIDLNKMGGPQFYQTGLQLCALPLSQVADDEIDEIVKAEKEKADAEIEDLAELLTDVLAKRLVAMTDSYSLQRQVKSTDEIQATSSSSRFGNALRPNQMDALEARLFGDARRSSEHLEKWLNG